MPSSVRIEIAKIVARAKRIGWRVEEGNGRQPWVYRIISPDGARVQLHGTPSDRNWQKAVIDDLNRLGFEEAERKWEIENEKIRKEKLASDKAAAERALQVAQTRAAAVVKAAGPYGPNVATVEWIFTRHPLPETKRCLVTPELAAKILDELNKANRPLRPGRVAYWVSIMKKGHWAYTHQGIAFDNRAVLQDGQHRLAAAVEAGFTLDINVSVGMPPENFALVDVGAQRSGGDTMAVDGKANAAVLAGAVKLLALWDRYGVEMRSMIRTRIPNDELREAAKKYGVKLESAVHEAKQIQSYKGAPRMSANALAAGIYLLSHRLPENDERVREFIRGYKEGTNLANGDARNTLRNFMYNLANVRTRVSPPEDQLALFIKCWNAWVNGRSIGTLSIRKDEMMPRVFLPASDSEVSGFTRSYEDEDN